MQEYINEGGMDMIRYVQSLLQSYLILTGVSLRDNEEAFDRYKIRPRVLVDTTNLDLSTTIFGTKVE
jgi:isopentenyl diphosphate isomerase/L-lactate dehydrogenase-like FMN-dependent dehydrogenase